MLLAVVSLCGVAVSEADPAAAEVVYAGELALELEGSGVLPQFPCIDCAVTFGGDVVGAGHAVSVRFGEYEVSFAVNEQFTASARYGEPASVYCPALGTASGRLTLTAPATGTAQRTDPPASGSVISVSIQLQYSYTRGGAAAAVITTGTVSVGVRFGASSKTLVFPASGGGAGAFVVDPPLAIARCTTPGPLPFSIAGGVVAKLS